MLKERTLARTALLASIAAIGLLFLLEQGFKPNEAELGGISEEMAGSKVSVKARVDNALHKDTYILFWLNDGTGKIKGIIFHPDEGQRSLLQKNSFVSVQGKVQLYKGKLEIVAEEVQAWH